MGWSIGYDRTWKRDIGYGVPAWCDQPGCNAEIDRGLANVCCHSQPYGDPDGCGLYFCGEHLIDKCERCTAKQKPFSPSPDHPRWTRHKLTDASWQVWRDDNPKEVAQLLNTQRSGD